jgi:ATP-dependent RNA helicase RhlE
MSEFSQFQLLPMLQAVLDEKKITVPSEIQLRAIPSLLGDKSVVGVSETGSGKTLAYALPVLHKIKELENSGQKITIESQPRVVVMVPTRELGEQVSKVFKLFTHTTRLRVRSALGGTEFAVSRRNVQGPFEILVATPGRLIKMLDRKLVNLSDVRTLIFDEADQMLDAGFLADANRIVKECPAERQMALFSATVTPATQTLIDQLFANAETIRSAGSHRVVPTLKTIQKAVIDGDRFSLLTEILSKPVDGGTLIFTNTREQCDKLAELLKNADQKCLIYRGEMDKVERRKNLKAFRDGNIKLLISTDLGGRGLDVENVVRVINYHLPKEMVNYIHRVGRTARAGRNGQVINMVTDRDGALMSKLGGIRSI